MDIEIVDIKYIEKEKIIEVGYGAKSIRLDVYVKDENNTQHKRNKRQSTRGYEGVYGAVNGVFTYGELADIIKEEVENVKINEIARREYITFYMNEQEIT